MTLSPSAPSTNRNALISFVTALCTLLTFCMGFVPIPFTALICYPVSLTCGIIALVTGIKALRQIRESPQPGRTLALIGIWSGALTIAAVICISTAFALLLPYVVDYFCRLGT